MADVDIERLGSYVEEWVQSAPDIDSVNDETRDAMGALVEANMVQYDPDGWPFKLHEQYPDAPKAEFKLMIRNAPGVDTNPDYYDRFTLPAALHAGEIGLLNEVKYVLGYPNAGTPIATAFVRLAKKHYGIAPVQLDQEKITNGDGTRELGDITSECKAGESVMAIDDTTTGGPTKVEGKRRIDQRYLKYAGLIILAERDPLGSAFVREQTDGEVYPSMHWMTIVKYAAKTLGVSSSAVQRELDYPARLFEWNVARGFLDNLPRRVD